jgi:hypothetical protein
VPHCTAASHGQTGAACSSAGEHEGQRTRHNNPSIAQLTAGRLHPINPLVRMQTHDSHGDHVHMLAAQSRGRIQCLVAAMQRTFVLPHAGTLLCVSNTTHSRSCPPPPAAMAHLLLPCNPNKTPRCATHVCCHGHVCCVVVLEGPNILPVAVEGVGRDVQLAMHQRQDVTAEVDRLRAIVWVCIAAASSQQAVSASKRPSTPQGRSEQTTSHMQLFSPHGSSPAETAQQLHNLCPHNPCPMQMQPPSQCPHSMPLPPALAPPPYSHLGEPVAEQQLFTPIPPGGRLILMVTTLHPRSPCPIKPLALHAPHLCPCGTLHTLGNLLLSRSLSTDFLNT